MWLQPFFSHHETVCLYRRLQGRPQFSYQKGKIDGNERNTIGEGERKESESSDITFVAMVVDRREKFDFFAAVFVVDRIIDGKDFSFVAGGQSTEKNDDFAGDEIQKASPVVPWRVEESIDGVASEFN